MSCTLFAGRYMTALAAGPTLLGVMDDHQEPWYVGAADAARILGVSIKTVRREAASGRLPGIRLGREWRFRLADLDNLTKRPPDTT
jgi:excisionase family DNA binding protein